LKLRPREVNRYRSGVHNPELEVLLFRRKKKIRVYIVDWKKGRVTEVGSSI